MEYPFTTVYINEKRNKDFFTAVIHGNFPEVERAYEEGASLDTSCDKCYATALQIAVAKGQDDIVLWLVEKGASVTLPNYRGFNAVYLAVQKNNLNALKAFINKNIECIARKVDLKYFEETKESRHLISHKSGDCHEIIDGLFIIDVMPDWFEELDFTLLDLAVNFEQLEMVKLLISKGADVSVDGFSLLMVAAIRGRTEMLKYLLEVPEVLATINFQEKTTNKSALMYAVVHSHLEATKLMISYGAEVTRRDEDGQSVLHLAAEIGKPEMLQALFDAPNMSNMIDYRDHFHYTPLMRAVQYGILESVNLLVSKGANVNVVSESGWNLFHIASFNGRSDILEYLLQNRHFSPLQKIVYVGFERENHGLTPLHLAAYNGHSGCVDVLFDQIGDYSKHSVSYQPWEKLNSGSAVVHATVIGGNYSILRKLNEFEFDQNVRDCESMTPLLLAIKINKFEFVKQLLLYGASLADRMPRGTGLYEYKTALKIIINYYPQPETILEEVLNSDHYIRSMNYTIPPLEATVKFDKLIINTDKQGNSIEGERNAVEYDQFSLIKSFLDCREYNAKKIILHPVMASLLFLFDKRLRLINYFLLLLHFTSTVTFSIMVLPKYKSGTVTWYICMAMVITWTSLINLQEILFRITSSDVNARYKFSLPWTCNMFTTIFCLATLYFERFTEVCPSFDHLRPFALICVWIHFICRMSWLYDSGVCLNIMLAVFYKMTRMLLLIFIIILGFNLILRSIFPEDYSFKNMFLEIAKTLAITQDLANKITARDSDMAVTVIALFTLVVSLALANFLTSLAFTNVEDLEKHGHVDWYLTRLKFLADLEAIMGSSPWRNYYVTKVIYLYFFKIDNIQVYFCNTDFDKNVLPPKIVYDLLKIILERNRFS